jgi:2-phospho-L-lactate/phosphoenolpyruvate guanylyltransferase
MPVPAGLGQQTAPLPGNPARVIAAGRIAAVDGTSRHADPGADPGDGAADGAGGWAVVLPVKRLAAGKSRLRGAVTGVPHEQLALALVLDTAAAALASPAVARVVAVTDDPEAAEALAALGAHTVPDPPGAGLNAAFAHGASLVAGAPVAALAGDLPALRPAELAAALRAAEHLQARTQAQAQARGATAGPGAAAPATGGATGARRFAADADGTGTVLLTVPPGGDLDPRFGPGSAAAHAASGAVPLDGAWPGLRRDVDTAADLAAAAALGLGPHTAELLRYGAHMQAVIQGTVATYDPGSRSGTLLLDDGTELAYPAEAFDASGLRLLRLGQRVRIDRDDSGAVVKITIPTLA